MVQEKNINPSFFMGSPGFNIIGALIYQELQDSTSEKEIDECINKILWIKNIYTSQDDRLQDELLYGSAGYLYCLLLLKINFPDK